MPLTISLDPESDGFLIEFPPLPGNHRTHHAKLPATVAGLIALLFLHSAYEIVTGARRELGER